MAKTITHLSSAHPRYDIRIFIKMCRSLASAGYNVNLIIADGKGNETKDGVNIFDIGRTSEIRLVRMTKSVYQVLRKAVSIKSDIYHLHDPELMPVGIILKILGRKVIFDAHEDLPKQLRSKAYLNPIVRNILSIFFSIFEWIFSRSFDYIITATPAICDKFLKINKNSIDINNYPLEGELFLSRTDVKKTKIIYTGVISDIRCISEMTAAFDNSLSYNLFLAGNIAEQNINSLISSNPKVHYLGELRRSELAELFSEAIAGLVVYKPVPNHIEAQPNKMFEYMSAGIPVIGSNFPLWQDIIEKYDCGICVNPLDVLQIREAIHYLTTYPKEAKRKGENGKRAVIELFNWNSQELRLLDVYKKVIYA